VISLLDIIKADRARYAAYLDAWEAMNGIAEAAADGPPQEKKGEHEERVGSAEGRSQEAAGGKG
jgi:hypothetical protein